MAGRSGNTEGKFTAEERAAMKQRAAELREEGKGGKAAEKKEREAQACRDAIAALTGSDRAIAEKLHAIVTEVAPQLEPKTWYGFPSYARDGKVVVFYQSAAKFKTRYGTIGFSEDAMLDDGVFWPAAYAVLEVTSAVEKELRGLVKRAAG
ncbi:uncharacterized protein YdhG (YjbR/CyaY superfamily) [Cryobacterium mesophilum]|uniref:YdhG-like domain-containing protein n=1 Tax=Terrimesophilobacter mesophilus TaxID=433647 RepID=A0A4R8VDG1_9MICO|nr:hypothetical protein [Terrimesophilobacter mesophilus]MBB5633478.1 uncharacterized protein YdhG (YjbR/CyaY superfamily) [Terrimesophilobacter mesophilus]TFB80190.1 hypothetical protein E3N84_09185 [Terrimesophilobacter mesophilus]